MPARATSSTSSPNEHHARSIQGAAARRPVAVAEQTAVAPAHLLAPQAHAQGGIVDVRAHVEIGLEGLEHAQTTHLHGTGQPGGQPERARILEHQARRQDVQLHPEPRPHPLGSQPQIGHRGIASQDRGSGGQVALVLDRRTRVESRPRPPGHDGTTAPALEARIEGPLAHRQLSPTPQGAPCRGGGGAVTTVRPARMRATVCSCVRWACSSHL